MKSNQRKRSARFVAVELLDEIEHEGAYSNLALDQAIKSQRVRSEDRALLTELIYGTLQRKLTLDYDIAAFVKKSKRLESWVRQLLRLSFYQMKYLDDIPEHAIVNEAVEITKMKGNRGVSGLVNGVLRNAIRRGFPDPTQIKNQVQKMSIMYSLPEWLVKEFIQQIGEEETVTLGQSLLERPRQSIRVNQKRLSRQKAEEMFSDLPDFSVTPSTVSPDGLLMTEGVAHRSPLFKEGAVTIQDESSMLVAPTLNVADGDLVLDACAAPGGKTTHIAQYLSKERGGEVIAVDIHAHKLQLVAENAKRQHVADVVRLQQADSTSLSDLYEPDTFDKVLVDAPCSGLGLIRRKPEIRYNISKEDIVSLQQLQLAILEEAATVLKPGGTLVYSTCTILNQENRDVVRQFLKTHQDFQPVEAVPAALNPFIHSPGQARIFPQTAGTDGFFIQSLRKDQ